jgi:uncharacterized protein YjbI with pentapeptide repeats
MTKGIFRRLPWRVSIRFLCVLLVLVVLVLIVWKVPQWQVANLSLDLKDRLYQENEFRKNWVQIAGGVFIVVGLYIAWVRSKAMRDQAAVDRERQVTDLYVKAIEQLGDKERLEVRLGGIYALERIARESEKDHWTVMEVLTAYVRENAPLEVFDDAPEGCAERLVVPLPHKPPTDIQAILTVLSRRTRTQGEYLPLDMRATFLQGADLYNARFDRALLSHANLQEASLFNANLVMARLDEANLERAKLNNAKLMGAILILAKLQEAQLWEAILVGAQMRGANLQGADFYKAQLQMAGMGATNLRGAKFKEANLENAILIQADLQGADFSGANLQGSVLIQSELQGANLREARGLTPEQLAKAIWDESTIWPEGFSPPQHQPETA